MLAAALMAVHPLAAQTAEFLQLPDSSKVDLAQKCPVCGMEIGGKGLQSVTLTYKDARVVGFHGVAAAVLKDGRVVGFDGGRAAWSGHSQINSCLLSGTTLYFRKFPSNSLGYGGMEDQ